MGATCCVVGARCVWVRDAYYNVISVLGVLVATWCEMRVFLDWCESLCPHKCTLDFASIEKLELYVLCCMFSNFSSLEFNVRISCFFLSN